MRTINNVTPISSHTRFQMRPAPEAESSWVEPGRLATIAKNTHIGIEYDLIDGTYHPIIKLWINGKRRKDCYLDENNQLDLRLHCRRIITLIKHNYQGDRPMESLMQITEALYSWKKQS